MATSGNSLWTSNAGGATSSGTNTAAASPVTHPQKVWEIVYAGLRIAGVLKRARRNFPITGSVYADCFEILNDMIDEWATQRLLVPAELPYDFPLVPLQQSYQIGPTGDWRITRPSRIERANVVLISQNPTAPLEIPMFILTLDGWRSIPQKPTQSVFPLYLYYDMSFNTPGGCGLVSVYPVPQVVNNVRLFLWGVLAQFGSLADKVAMPPGYLKCVKYNLAKEIAMRFPEQAAINPGAVLEAAESMRKLKILNSPLMDMPIDEALIKRPAGMWNWRTGNYQGNPF